MFKVGYIHALLAKTDITKVAHVLFPEDNKPRRRSKKSKYYWARCFNHQEATPSLSLRTDSQNAHCFGCGFHARDAIALLMVYNICSFPEAMQQLMVITGFYPSDFIREAEMHKRLLKQRRPKQSA